MITEPPAGSASTRDRLAAAALRLFADQGYTGTTVGEIERAAGLRPRRGGLYRHFASKEALLDEAVALHVARIDKALVEMASLPAQLDAGGLQDWAMWFLEEMDAERDIFRLLEHDGPRLERLRATMRDRVIDAGHQLIAELIRRRRGAGVDAEALAVLIVGPLANHRRTEWTFGAPPAGVSKDRLVAAWARTLQVLMSQSPL